MHNIFDIITFMTIFTLSGGNRSNFRKQPITVVKCVITSTMKRDDREKNGLPSGFELGRWVSRHYERHPKKPLLCFVTMSTDRQEALAAGFTIFSC